MQTDKTVVVELPMTMRISVTFPDGAPRDPQASAAALADWAARKLSHISHDQIAACNELNRLFPHGAGVVAHVDARIAGETKAA